MPPSISRSAHYKNDLRRLTAMIGMALAFFGVVLVAVIFYTGWSADRDAVQRERQQVENALDDGVSRVLDEQKSIAWWDDAVINVAGGQINSTWVDIEIGAFLNETYGHDEVYILNSANMPVYAYVNGVNVAPGEAFARHEGDAALVVREARGGEAPGLRKRARAFELGQGNYRELLGATHAGWSAHVLNVDGRPYVVSAITIVPNVDASLLHGTPYLLLSFVSLDADFVSTIGAGLLLPDLALRDEPLHGAAVVAEPFMADDETPLGNMTWTTRRPGHVLMVFILPLVIVGLICASLLTAAFIRRLKRASAALSDREAESRHQALHDALSGLPNRRNFVERLQGALDGMV